MLDAAYGLNDFQGLIKEQQGRSRGTFTPEQSAAEHALSRAWLSERLAESFAGPLVVVTHHAPSRRSVEERFDGDALSPCFASDLPDQFFDVPDLWIHGHIHSSADYVQGHARVLANPRGYPVRGGNENLDFNPSLIVEIK